MLTSELKEVVLGLSHNISGTYFYSASGVFETKVEVILHVVEHKDPSLLGFKIIPKSATTAQRTFVIPHMIFSTRAIKHLMDIDKRYGPSITSESGISKCVQPIKDKESSTTPSASGHDTDLGIGGNKNDEKKDMFALFPPEALEDVCKVLNYGAGKYGVRNWEKGIVYSRLFSATMRHLWAWWRKEDSDQETGISHLAHAACNMLFLLHFEHFAKGSTQKNILDDRPEYQETGILRNKS